MRQVYACGKNLATAILGMIHHAAAQHANFACGSKHAAIAGALRVIKRVVVFRIEKSWTADRDDRRLALPLDPGRTKTDRASLGKFGYPLQRFSLRKQHRFAQVHPY